MRCNRVLKLTLQQQETLIDLVQENPHLYDPKCELYRNKQLTKATWTEIARKMDIEGFDEMQCKLKWKSTKDYFVNVRKKIRASKASGHTPQITKGPFYGRLQFLVGCVPVSMVKGRTVRTVRTIKTESPLSTTRMSTGVSEISTDNIGLNDDMDLSDNGQQQDVLGSSVAEQQYAAEYHTTHSSLHRTAQRNTSGFYAMMEEKMQQFPRKQQVWMENQIWNSYIQLENLVEEQTGIQTVTMLNSGSLEN